MGEWDPKGGYFGGEGVPPRGGVWVILGISHLEGVLGLLGSQAPLWAGVRLPSCRGVWDP